MKNLILLFGLFFGFVGFVSGQDEGDYDANTFLIQFDDDTTQEEIDQIREDFNCEEIWVSPLSETHYWRVNSFPFVIPGTQDTISDVNDATNESKNRSGVNEGSLDFYSSTDPLSGLPALSASINQLTEADHLPCVDFNENTELNDFSSPKICIMDTGYSTRINNITIETGKSYISSDNSLFDTNGHGSNVLRLLENTLAFFPHNSIRFDIRKTHDRNGVGRLSNILLAIEEAILNDVNIINMSFSYLAPINELEGNILKRTVNIATSS